MVNGTPGSGRHRMVSKHGAVGTGADRKGAVEKVG